MNLHALQHRMAPWDAYSVHRNHLTLRLRAAFEDLACAELVYWPRSTPENCRSVQMEVVAGDGLFNYYETELDFADTARYLKYYFFLAGSNGEKIYLSTFGPQENIPTDGYFEHLYTNEGDLLCLPDWAQGVIYYQIFVDRFYRNGTVSAARALSPWGIAPDRELYTGGNLAGILHKLEHIASLGVGCLYLTPIFKANFNHKYATIDYYEVDPDFGDLATLKKLVEGCHKKGIRVLLDGVFNHCGVEFPPFRDLLENQDRSAYRDWFYVKKYPVNISEGSYECVGDYRWMPKLNTSNSEVRGYILDVMRYWIRKAHIDGWRLDVADEVDYRVWEYAHAEIKAEWPDILLLGETWGDASKLLSGRQLDTTMNYLFRDSLLAFLARRSIAAAEFAARLGGILARYHSLTNDTLYNMLDSHDTTRFLTECGGDKRLLKLGAALQMTFPGSPAIYYGDEMGLAGENDPDCRRCMPWENPDEDLLSWYRRLAALRQAHPALRTGKYAAVLCEGDVFAYMRRAGNEILTVALNRGEAVQRVLLPMPAAGNYRDALCNAEYTASGSETGVAIQMDVPAKAVMILTEATD